MRREHFADFQAQLAMVRLQHADDASATVPDGCSMGSLGAVQSHSEKRKNMNELFELHYTKKELQCHDRVYWLTERQYKSYQKMFENCTAQEADAKYAEDIANTRIRRKYNAGGELMLAVRTAPLDAFVKVSGHSQSVKKNLEEEFGVGDLDSLRRLLRTVLEAPPDQQQAAALGGEAAWEPQSASLGMPPAPLPVPSRKGAKPTSAVVSGLLSTTASDGGSGVGSVSCAASSVASSTTPKVTGKPSVEMGLLTVANMQHMGLVKARQYVLAQGRKVAREEHQVKKSAYRRLAELIEKLGREHEEVKALEVAKDMTQFEELIDIIKAAVAAAPSWTMHNFAELGMEAVKSLKDALAKVPVLEEKLTTLTAVRTLEVRKAASDRRKLSLKCRNATIDLREQGLWPNALTWFGKNVFGLTTVNVDATCVTNLKALAQGERPEERVAVYKPDSPRGPALDAFAARMTYLQPKIESALPKLKAHMEEKKMDRTMTLLKPKAEEITMEQAVSWTPDNYELYKHELGHWIGRHSSAWVMYDKVGVMRMGLEELAFDTLGGTWKVLKGGLIVFLWNVEDLVKKNGDETLDMEGFMEAMTVTEAGLWLDKHAGWVRLREGETLWKPPCVAQLTVSLEPETWTVWQPFHSQAALDAHPTGKSVMRDLHTFYDNAKGEPYEALAAAWKAGMSK